MTAGVGGKSPLPAVLLALLHLMVPPGARLGPGGERGEGPCAACWLLPGLEGLLLWGRLASRIATRRAAAERCDTEEGWRLKSGVEGGEATGSRSVGRDIEADGRGPRKGGRAPLAGGEVRTHLPSLRQRPAQDRGTAAAQQQGCLIPAAQSGREARGPGKPASTEYAPCHEHTAAAQLPIGAAGAGGGSHGEPGARQLHAGRGPQVGV